MVRRSAHDARTATGGWPANRYHTTALLSPVLSSPLLTSLSQNTEQEKETINDRR